jgi:hypothetical protein
LKDNGGPTQTIALVPGSAAVDHVPVSPVDYCTAADGVTPITTDQRGVARPQGAACDVGAFEFAAQSSQSAVQAVIDSISSLVSTATVSLGNGNSLISKLQSAIVELNAGDASDARGAVTAFINEVNAMVKSGRLSASQGAALISAAQGVLALVS